MDIKKVQEQAYNTAVKRGQYQARVSKNYCISRILEEVYEMIGAYVKRNIADREYFDFATSRKWFKMPFGKAYKKYIKDTVQDEFADILITIASISHQADIELTGDVQGLEWKRNFNKHSIHENGFAFAKNATREYRKGGIPIEFSERMNFLYVYTLKWCESLNIDIDYYVDLKLKYNEHRRT